MPRNRFDFLLIAVIVSAIASAAIIAHANREHRNGAILIASPETAFVQALRWSDDDGSTAPKIKRCDFGDVCSNAPAMLVDGYRGTQVFVKGQFNAAFADGSVGILGAPDSRVSVNGVGELVPRYIVLGTGLATETPQSAHNGQFLFLRRGHAAGDCPTGCYLEIAARDYTLFVSGRGQADIDTSSGGGDYRFIGDNKVATLVDPIDSLHGFTGRRSVSFGAGSPEGMRHLISVWQSRTGEKLSHADHMNLHLTGHLSADERVRILLETASDNVGANWQNGTFGFVR